MGSLLHSACNPDSLRRAEALNRLFLLYWRPVYAFIRKRGFAVEDAKDLTQDFMLELFKRGSLERYDSGKGRFRTFLRGALGLFLAQARRAEARRARRGGPPVPFSLLKDLEGPEFAADLERRTDEELFDKQLAYELLQRAVRLLRRELRAAGAEVGFEIYRAYELGDDKPGRTYASVAAEFGLTEDGVRKHLETARRHLKKILLRLIGEWAPSRQEMLEELRDHRACWRMYGMPDRRMFPR